jgi:hypothetical protein
VIPIPGFEELALTQGLLSSTQVSGGVELGLPMGFNLDAQIYYQDMDPVLFDLAVNASSDGVSAGRRGPGEPIVGTSTPGVFEGGSLLARRVGRSYGFELLIKQEASERFYGWLSYTLSWSERLFENQWVPFDFDRRHVMNLVSGVSLPRNWDIGVRVQVQSGRPFTSSAGFNQGRTDPYVGVSLRVDKRAVWDRWLFDFYIDLINITLTPEQIDARVAPVRIGVPTVGFRAVL